ncbi:MAG: NAD(P)-dependent oxidoreductase [Alphaproteobacteria bacterium]|nr:NAD(P)-dependent oxidoreductase [Alphaproteobacteria bacterium]
MSKPSIGFLGLGLMGSAMCQRLLDLSYPLTVIANRSRENVDKAVARGAVEVKTAREVAERSDIVMLCMDTSASVESRMYGDDGVIAGLNPQAVTIDFGTSLPNSTRAIGEAVSAKDATYLDAPLGRTPAHALDGALNIMCSGDRAAYDRVEPVLKDLGENVFHLGALGSGHTIKLINNFFAMTTANAMAEAFAIADKMGVAREQVYAVMSAGPNHSSMMDFVKAYAVDGNSNALEFAIKNANKDVGYYGQMASDVNVDSIMSKSVREALSSAVDAGFGDKMVSEMVDFLAEKYAEPGSS